MIEIKDFYDSRTGTFTYIVADSASKCCAVIDPVLDYSPGSAYVGTESADRIVAEIEYANYELQWILETHAHADHLSAAAYIQERCGGKIAIGEHIRSVQRAFSALFNLGNSFPVDGTQFDKLLQDGEQFSLGGLTVEVIHTPGHTPACVSYKISDKVFVGDTLFRPSYGTARADFPGGSARQLYQSVRKLLALPPQTQLYMCHDYPANGEEPSPRNTVEDQRLHNVLVNDTIDENEYIEARNKRDSQLEVPALILPSLQVNIRAGKLPNPETNNVHYLKIPLNQLGR